jgi:hypothetical protein
MEPKILGIILAILGITSLILSLIFINDAVSDIYVYIISACGIFGAVLFFVGIRLIPNRSAYDKYSV